MTRESAFSRSSKGLQREAFSVLYNKSLPILCAIFIPLWFSTVAVAESGTWDFDSSSPAFEEKPGPTDPHYGYLWRNGVLEASMTREGTDQRLYIPLSGGSYGNNDTFRLRFRFKKLDQNSASNFCGFFGSTSANTGSNNQVFVENYGMNAPQGYQGSATGRAGFSTVADRWYVAEMSARALNSTWNLSVYEGDGTTLIDSSDFTTGGTGGGIDQIGFGNESCCPASSVHTVQYDWVVWSINEPLPEDPPSSDPLMPAYAPIPSPLPFVAGLWLLDETEGPAGEENWGVYDQSGHGNHGYRAPLSLLSERPAYSSNTPNPQTWNYSLDFGASGNARVEMPDSASLDLTEGFTVECWVNLNSLSGNQYFVSKRNSSGNASGYFLEWADTSQTFQFGVGTSGGYRSVLSKDLSVTTGQWYHLAGVHNLDATGAELALYIDGALNNTAFCEPTVLTNDDPLWFGNWAAGGKSADCLLDEVKVSSRVVPPAQLGYHDSFGPAQIIFGDAFETYSGTGDLLTRCGGDRNHWKVEPLPQQSTFSLSSSQAHSGNYSTLLGHENASGPGNYVSLYYNSPVAITRDSAQIAIGGCVSFFGQENVRLFFLNQVWTGVETHYGVTMTNLAGGVQYNGETRSWQVESSHGGYESFSPPIDYSNDLNEWHYFRFAVDFEAKEYVYFQFDENRWDLSGRAILVLPDFFAASVLPVMDHNVRLLELPGSTYPHTAFLSLDDAFIAIEDQQLKCPHWLLY